MLMCNVGLTTSSFFKTNHKYGLQPISICNKTKLLLQLYLRYVRPNCPHGKQLIQPTDPLFITWNGDSDTSVGRKLTSFFEGKNDLHMTSTAIRGLMETTAEGALQRGEITMVQRASVSSLNGHSSAVVKNYYLKSRTAKDVENARAAVKSFAQPSDTENILLNRLQEINGDGKNDDDILFGENLNLPEYTEWGAEHPDYNKPVGSKARWTKTELSYIYKAAKDILRSYPDKTNIVARILIKIKSDPLAQPIFHSRHVLRSGRLRFGYQQIVDKLNID